MHATPGAIVILNIVFFVAGGLASGSPIASAQLPSAPAIADFTLTVVGLVLTVDASPSSGLPAVGTAYDWSWGDGTANGTGLTADHAYSRAGTYRVTLTATAASIAPAALSKTVTVASASAPSPPTTPTVIASPGTSSVAAFVFSTSAGTVLADASSSVPSTSALDSFVWDWGDGSPAASGVQVAHTYAKSGTFPVKLTVSDLVGITASVVHDVLVDLPTVTPTPPTLSTLPATPTLPPTPAAPRDAPPVSLGGTLTVTASGLIVTGDAKTLDVATFEWSWGDASPSTFGPTATHTYASAGRFTITLTQHQPAGDAFTFTREVQLGELAGAAPAASSPSSAATPAPPGAHVPGLGPLAVIGVALAVGWGLGTRRRR